MNHIHHTLLHQQLTNIMDVTELHSPHPATSTAHQHHHVHRTRVSPHPTSSTAHQHHHVTEPHSPQPGVINSSPISSCHMNHIHHTLLHQQQHHHGHRTTCHHTLLLSTAHQHHHVTEPECSPHPCFINMLVSSPISSCHRTTFTTPCYINSSPTSPWSQNHIHHTLLHQQLTNIIMS